MPQKWLCQVPIPRLSAPLPPLSGPMNCTPGTWDPTVESPPPGKVDCTIHGCPLRSWERWNGRFWKCPGRMRLGLRKNADCVAGVGQCSSGASASVRTCAAASTMCASSPGRELRWTSLARPRPWPLPSRRARHSAWRRFVSTFLAALASFLACTCRCFSSFSFLRCSLVASLSAALRLACSWFASRWASKRSHPSVYASDVKILDLVKSSSGCCLFLLLAGINSGSTRNELMSWLSSSRRCAWKSGSMPTLLSHAGYVLSSASRTST